jgi:hypothetical protein
MEQRLEQAVRTLRGIRQRYETDRNVGSGYVRSCSLDVELGYADMLWIAAAIEALERAVASNSRLPGVAAREGIGEPEEPRTDPRGIAALGAAGRRARGGAEALAALEA